MFVLSRFFIQDPKRSRLVQRACCGPVTAHGTRSPVSAEFHRNLGRRGKNRTERALRGQRRQLRRLLVARRSARAAPDRSGTSTLEGAQVAETQRSSLHRLITAACVGSSLPIGRALCGGPRRRGRCRSPRDYPEDLSADTQGRHERQHHDEWTNNEVDRCREVVPPGGLRTVEIVLRAPTDRFTLHGYRLPASVTAKTTRRSKAVMPTSSHSRPDPNLRNQPYSPGRGGRVWRIIASRGTPATRCDTLRYIMDDLWWRDQDAEYIGTRG